MLVSGSCTRRDCVACFVIRGLLLTGTNSLRHVYRHVSIRRRLCGHYWREIIDELIENGFEITAHRFGDGSRVPFCCCCVTA